MMFIARKELVAPKQYFCYVKYSWHSPLTSVSTCPKGEFICSDVSIGIPLVLGKNGVERIIELNLSREYKLRFDRSIAESKKAIASLKF